MADLLKASPEMTVEYGRWFVTGAHTAASRINRIENQADTTTIGREDPRAATSR